MLLIDRKEVNEFSVLKMEKKRNAKTELDFYAVWLFFFFFFAGNARTTELLKDLDKCIGIVNCH